jgi:chromate transporter
MTVAMTENEQQEIQPLPPSLPMVFWSFLRLGLTAFGGPAMVAYIGELATVKKGWLSRKSFQHGVAIAQTIPGATAMQTAAYVGLRTRGISGAAAAYIGFGLPAFILMVALSIFYDSIHHSPIGLSVFRGLQVIVIAIVARATINFGRSSLHNLPDILLGFAAALYLSVGGNPIYAILADLLAGIIIFHSSNRAQEAAPAAGAELHPILRKVLIILVVAGILLLVLLVVNRRLFELAFLMLKIDLFAFGGGFASVPLMLHEVVQVKQWMEVRTFMDGLALGQITPGPIVITAAFVGYKLLGLLGAAVGTIAIFLPSFVLLILAVPYFDRLQHNPAFRNAMRGVLASFVGLLLSVTVKFILVAPWTPPSVLLAMAAFIALMRKVDILWVVLGGAAVSALILR